MSTVLSNVSLRNWLLKKPDWLERETVFELIFSLKTFAASLLALLSHSGRRSMIPDGRC